jgi:ABC-type methionine transport system ATPase subunit
MPAETRSDMQHLKLNLTFPIERVNQAVLAQAIKTFDVTVDIRRAQVQSNVGGYIMLEMTGTDEQLDGAIAFMKSLGVGVGFIGSDEVQAY